MNGLYVTNKIMISASPQKVWNVLVDPSQTKKYMFGCETVSDWKAGSELLWKGEYQGKEMVFVKGTIKEIRLDELLVYTVIDPNNPAITDKPENYLTVTYKLEQDNGQTLLTVSQGDFSKVADGEKRYKETYNNGVGWDPILVQIKKIAEEK
ncbi:MAG TPA: SRPBCC domain-containing protein [Bacteroidia bacterium]